MFKSKYSFAFKRLSLSLAAVFAASSVVAQPAPTAPMNPNAMPMGANGPAVPPPMPTPQPSVMMSPMMQAARPQSLGDADQQTVDKAVAEALAREAKNRKPAASILDVPAGAEGARPRNPLEEVSKLNAEAAALKAKLQIVELKAQIKKKEDELVPPPAPPKVVYIEKKVKAEPVAAEEKPKLPPLPDLSVLEADRRGEASRSPVRGAGEQKASDDATKVAPQSQQQNARPMMTPRVLAIEGVQGNLRADISTDWGGTIRATEGDRYFQYEVVKITPSAVYMRKDGEKNADGYGVYNPQLAMGANGQMGGMQGGAGMMGAAGMMPTGTSPMDIKYPAMFDPKSNGGMISTPDGRMVQGSTPQSAFQSGMNIPVTGISGLLSGAKPVAK